MIIPLLTSCSMIDEDRSDCETTKIEYDLTLVTNITTEIETQNDTRGQIPCMMKPIPYAAPVRALRTGSSQRTEQAFVSDGKSNVTLGVLRNKLGSFFRVHGWCQEK